MSAEAAATASRGSEAPTPATVQGLLLGVLAVAAFSLTLPATRIAVADFSPLFVGFGRAVAAALAAGLFLLAGGQRWPTARETRSLAVVAGGVVVGFPLLSALAMRDVEAAHGAVMMGVLPLATAVAGAVLTGERPSIFFWLAAVAGGAVVVVFGLVAGGGELRWADAALVGACICAAIGYAEGARLARSLGGLNVISWALVIAAPFLVLPAAWAAPADLSAPWPAWLSFAYVSLMSQFIGFVAWYRALNMGGIARVSQIQLLQPFFTLFAAAVLLGEAVAGSTVGFAVLVLVIVAVGARARIAAAPRI